MWSGLESHGPPTSGVMELLPSHTCGTPGVIPHGVIHGARYNMGDKIRYSCESGFVLEGHSILTCIVSHGSGAQWDFPSPFCRGTRTSGCHSASARYNMGDKIRYSCESGFVLEGHSILTCIVSHGSGAQWDFPSPFCRGTRTSGCHSASLLL
ncbi:hypothetical protein CRUP_019240 [Coryphaenoides rupestris]|nr:hypothetical protein CRUP_019240 [Coryphaenoides rupestris]